MNPNKIQTPQGTFVVQQGINDIKKGIELNDPSRITVAGGQNGAQGGHFGSNSQSSGRGGKPFGQ